MRKLIPLMLLAACATPYQPLGALGGYSDTEMGKNRYLISFQGNGYTHANLVQQYASRRAKEFCSERGFTNFQLVQMQDGAQQANMSCYNGLGGLQCSQSGSKPKTSLLIECVN